jgi:hypothetical protein
LLIASAAPAIGIAARIAASLAIASAGAARSVRMLECGILIYAPSEMVSGVAGIIGPERSAEDPLMTPCFGNRFITR